MFIKVLSTRLLQILDDRKITVEKMAEMCSMSRKFVGNIISGKQIPTLNSFEKMCSALQLTPNELLLSDESANPDKAVPMKITEILCLDKDDPEAYYPICPNCQISLEMDHQAFCGRCGQRLNLSSYTTAKITYLQTK